MIEGVVPIKADQRIKRAASIESEFPTPFGASRNESQRRYVIERNGRHEGTRTPDLYRVNFEVTYLKPFACLAFPV